MLFIGKTTLADDLCLDITAVVPNTDSSSHVSSQVKQFLMYVYINSQATMDNNIWPAIFFLTVSTVWVAR